MNFVVTGNTPGFFYTLGYAMSTGIVLMWEKGGVKRKRWLCLMALWLFLSGFMYLTRDAYGALYALSMTVILLAMFACFRLNVEDGVRAGFLTIKAFIYGEFSSSLCWQVYYALAVQHPWFQSESAVNLVMFPGFVFIGLCVWLGERSLHKSGVEVDFTWRDIAVEFLIALSAYVVSNMAYIDPSGLFSGSFARDIYAIRTVVDMSGVAMIYAFQRQLLEVQTRFEMDTLHSIMQMQYQTYQLSQESIDMVNQKYHDLKHQIALLRAEIASGRAKESLDRMERDIRRFEAQHRTGNPVLDAVLTSKSLYCQNHGIELKYMADGRLLSRMDDMEVAALFGNMLDNAIESSQTIPDKRKRLIRLYVAGEKGFLRIRIENYCEERIRFQDGMPVTTKRDKRYHGFGMKSMRRTVERYGGSMVAEQADNWFQLKILIPLAADTPADRIKEDDTT